MKPLSKSSLLKGRKKEMDGSRTIPMLGLAVFFLAAAIPAYAQRTPGNAPGGYYGDIVKQLNPNSDPVGGQCAKPFSSGTGFDGQPQWVHVSVDLSAYSNKMVAIRFFFDTRDSLYNNFKGWYIDNIRITPRISAPGQGPDTFSDEVENGNNGWFAGGNHGTTPGWHITNNRSLSGTHSWWFGNEATGTYQEFPASCQDTRSFGALLSPVMKLGSSPRLEFDTFWEIESVNPASFDLLQVQVELDSDEDGLLDDWETDGVDGDGDGIVDLILPGANPNHKDIYVEADFMEAVGHSHNPNSSAINVVTAAFAAAPVGNLDGVSGINLHVLVDESITEQTALSMWADFDALKSARFGTALERASPKSAAILAAKRRAYHYAIFGHNQTGTSSSGISELPGNDFLISLGAFTNQVGDNLEQAGTFMHELGHNLGLRHGGGDNNNRKPNYLSTMNYTFQTRGITNLAQGTRIDYSRSALPALNENSLSELAGIGDGLDVTRYFCPGSDSANGIAIGFLPIDWNCNGLITLSGAISSDVNGDPTVSTLVGFHDWSHLKLNFQDTTDFGDGVHESTTPQAQPEPELDPIAASSIPRVQTVSIDIVPGNPSNPINLSCGGPTRVAILSSPGFNASSVVPQSVRFANSSTLNGSAVVDVNGDGLPDLVLDFVTQSLQLTESSTNASVTGMTVGGIAIVGMDSVHPLNPDIFIRDDSSGNLVQFNSITGVYQFTRCADGFTLSGTGTVRLVNSVVSLSDSRPDRTISAGFYTGQLTGRANVTLIPFPGVYQTITINQTKPKATCSCGG